VVTATAGSAVDWVGPLVAGALSFEMVVCACVTLGKGAGAAWGAEVWASSGDVIAAEISGSAVCVAATGGMALVGSGAAAGTADGAATGAVVVPADGLDGAAPDAKSAVSAVPTVAVTAVCVLF
jgi:hypothetical protein